MSGEHLASDLAILSLNSLPSAGGHAALTITGRPRRGSLRPAVAQICQPMDFRVHQVEPGGNAVAAVCHQHLRNRIQRVRMLFIEPFLYGVRGHLIVRDGTEIVDEAVDRGHTNCPVKLRSASRLGPPEIAEASRVRRRDDRAVFAVMDALFSLAWVDLSATASRACRFSSRRPARKCLILWQEWQD